MRGRRNDMARKGANMPLEELLLITRPEAGRVPLVCLPGTYCFPAVFELVDERTFPHLQILPVFWMMADGPWDIPTLGLRGGELIGDLQLGPALLGGRSAGGGVSPAAAGRGTRRGVQHPVVT